jgi:glutaminyl-peptide cyclotransferase
MGLDVATRIRQGATRWLRERWLETILLVGLAIAVGWLSSVAYGFVPKPPPRPTPDARVGEFSGVSAMKFVTEQLAFGPRPTGSEASILTGDYIRSQLEASGWSIEIQPFTYRGVSGRNIIARAGSGPPAVIGAHYDTRLRADEDPDPDLRNAPMLGANDGASGVAVLLELARTLNKEKLKNEVWLTFFDAEDNGNLDGWQYSAGSEFLAGHLREAPKMVVIVDMIGDADQQIYKERNSTPALQEQLWSVAADLGYSAYFIPQVKWPITDDHIPFLRRGYAAVDLIDFDYPYWHTTQDTADKLSAGSLERVGKVLQTFLERDSKEPRSQ